MSIQRTDLSNDPSSVQCNRASTSGSGSRGVLVVLAATVAMALGFGGLGLITVFMKPMEADLGWSRTGTSLGYALSSVGMAVGGMFWGRLSDRIDVRGLFVIGATGMVGSLLAMSILKSLPVFYLAHLAYGGFGFSVLYAPLLSTSGEWFPERRGLVTGVVTAGGAIGQGLLPFFASFLIATFGWRWAFAGTGCTVFAGLLLALPWLKWPQGTRAPAASSVRPHDAAKTERVKVAMLAGAAFLCCMCMGVPVVHLANFVGTVCGSAAVGAKSLVIAMIAGAVGRVCCGLIADRIGPLQAYAVVSLIQTGAVLAFPSLESSLSLMALSAIFGFGFAGNMTCLSLCVRQTVPANRFGGAIGTVMMVAWAGMATGGYFGGVFYDLTHGYTVSFIVAGAAGVMNLAILGVLRLVNVTSDSASPNISKTLASSNGAACRAPIERKRGHPVVRTIAN